MALHNSLHTGSAANPVLSAQDARLAQAGMLALNGPGPLDVRQGILYAPGLPLNVTGNSSTSPWQYIVAAGSYVASKGNLDGPHMGTNDAATLVTTIAPPGSNSRYDLIYVMQQDADATISPDGTTVPLIGVVNGTAGASPAVPALPAGAIALATALVLSSATGGTSGAGVTIDNTVSRYTSVRNAHIPVRNATERAEITVRDGLQVYRLDTHQVETYNGSAWTFPNQPISVVGSVLAGTYNPAKPVLRSYYHSSGVSDPTAGVINVPVPVGATCVLGFAWTQYEPNVSVGIIQALVGARGLSVIGLQTKTFAGAAVVSHAYEISAEIDYQL
jgi:hypothetical protein